MCVIISIITGNCRKNSEREQNKSRKTGRSLATFCRNCVILGKAHRGAWREAAASRNCRQMANFAQKHCCEDMNGGCEVINERGEFFFLFKNVQAYIKKKMC
jgi:hypothetical protein